MKKKNLQAVVLACLHLALIKYSKSEIPSSDETLKAYTQIVKDDRQREIRIRVMPQCMNIMRTRVNYDEQMRKR